MKKLISSIIFFSMILVGCGVGEETEKQVADNSNIGSKAEVHTATFKVIDTKDLDEYEVEIVPYSANSNKNMYEQVFEHMLPDVKVIEILDNSDETVTINFDPLTIAGPHLTSSAQLSVFMDKIKYAMKENFPELKGYYFVVNGEQGDISEFGTFTEMLPNNWSEEELYLPIKK